MGAGSARILVRIPGSHLRPLALGISRPPTAAAGPPPCAANAAGQRRSTARCSRHPGPFPESDRERHLPFAFRSRSLHEHKSPQPLEKLQAANQQSFTIAGKLHGTMAKAEPVAHRLLTMAGLASGKMVRFGCAADCDWLGPASQPIHQATVPEVTAEVNASASLDQDQSSACRNLANTGCHPPGMSSRLPRGEDNGSAAWSLTLPQTMGCQVRL